MLPGESGQNQVFDRKEAEIILKNLWLTFNNFTMYGTDHQMTKKACIDLHVKFLDVLAVISPLTIHVEEESLFCESWKVEKKKFAARLVTRFKSAGIQSVAFEKGLSTEALNLFITMLNDPTNFVTVETMKETFEKKDIRGIRLNFITFRKVLDDEIVVKENFGEFVQILSVGHIVSQSDDVAKNLRAQIKDGGPALLVDYLIKLRERVPFGVIDSGKLPPPNEILEALAVLKKGIIEDLQADSTTGVIDKAGEEAVREMDNLADEVIIKIIREEYKAGLKSPKDLALLIRRLIPDTINLKRLIPRIKEVLLAEGMSLTEYLEMVRCLAGELQGSSLIELLKDAAEEIGVSVSEIVKDLKNNPQAAARLIILASEIRSNLSGSDDEFIAILSDYIERVSMKMTKEEIAGSSELDSDNIEETLSRLEYELLRDLGVNGIEPVQIDSIGSRLAKRLPDAVVQLKDEIVREESGGSGKVSATGTVEDNGKSDFGKGGTSGKETIREKGIIGKIMPARVKSPLPDVPGHLKDGIVGKGGIGSGTGSGSGTGEVNVGGGFGKRGGSGKGTTGEKGSTGKMTPAGDTLPLSDAPGRLKDAIVREGGGGSGGASGSGTGEVNRGSGFGTGEGSGEGTTGEFGTSGKIMHARDTLPLQDAPGAMKNGIVGKGGIGSGTGSGSASGEVNRGSGFGKGEGSGEGKTGEKGIAGKITPAGDTLPMPGAPGRLKDEIVGERGGGSGRAYAAGTGEATGGGGFGKGEGSGEGTIGEKVITGKITPAGKKSPSLPKEVLRIKDLKKYLQREIWRNNRYKTPFACLSVSIVHINNGENPSDEKAAGIFTEICRILSESIRSLDLVGSLGSLADNYMLLILTETTQDGADILRGRLEKKFNTIKISFNSEEIVPKVRVSAVSYDGEKKPKMTTFVKKVKANHKQPFKD